MPSLRARPEEAEMEPSVPGPSPWTPSAQACVSDATTANHPASAFCDPLDCSDTELGTTPPPHQQPGTGTEFPTGTLILRGLCVTQRSPLVVCGIIRGGVLHELEGPTLEATKEVGLDPGCTGVLSVALWFPCLT